MSTAAAPIVWHFAGCEVHEYPEQGENGYLVSVWPDGAQCPATRDHTMENSAYCRHLGYEAIRDALREHELAHHAVAGWLGQPCSPTLRAVAVGFAAGTVPYEQMLHEEALVLDFQRYMQTGDIGPALNPYRLLAPGWRDEFRRRFCGWPTSVAA